MGLVNTLFKLARLSADLKALSSGDPKRIARRGKNKLLGRAMARGGGCGSREARFLNVFLSAR